MIMGVIAFAMLLCAALAYVLISNVALPLRRMTEVMKALAGGDRAIDVAGAGRGDEIGAMAAAVQVFKDGLIAADALTVEKERDNAAKVQRASNLERLMQSFETDAGGLVSQIFLRNRPQLEATVPGDGE